MATLTSSETQPVVVLRGGLSVPLAALRVLWDLEDRGLTVRLADGSGLLVGPPRRLTDADRSAIRRHRDQLIRLVRDCDEVVA